MISYLIATFIHSIPW